MAATNYSLIERVTGTSWSAAYANHDVAKDIIQIVHDGKVMLNVDSTGVVHSPASGATSGTHAGVYFTNLASGNAAQLFADAFANPTQLDVLQLIDGNGGILNYIDFAGVSH